MPVTQLGAFPTLAYARSVLFDLLGASPGDATLLQAEADVLSEVERLTGRTTIIKQVSSVTVVQPASADSWQLVTVPASTSTGQPQSVVASPLDVRSAGRDGTYKGYTFTNQGYPSGFGRAELDALSNNSLVSRTPATVVGQGSVASQLARLTWTPSGSNWNNYSLTLHTSGLDTKQPYVYLGSRGASTAIWESAVGTEGWLVDLVKRITSVQDVNWSRPRYDGFGLPVKWVPPADASLLGGTAGQDAYAYMLQSAKSAAEDATAAVQTAINDLADQAHDDNALQQAESKASQEAQSDQTSLCGSGTCDLPTGYEDFRWHVLEKIPGACGPMPATVKSGPN